LDKTTAKILQQRMHGLYLTRKCDCIVQLAQELLGMHCWFHRNVLFSAVIRGAGLMGWKHALTKTWIHHALHGVAMEDLPTLLALNTNHWHWVEEHLEKEIAGKVINLMEDGVYSRAEMRLIFADEYDSDIIRNAFSSWGGIFVELARRGKVAFRDMASRDFDLIDAEPTQTFEEVLPGLFRRFLAAYGPATLADAAWFFGLWKETKKELLAMDMDMYPRLEHEKKVYFYIDDNADMGEIPEVTLLSGFDPYIVSYTERSMVLPQEYKKAVITRSGICLPTFAINGVVAGLWNIKKGEPFIEYFTEQPKRITDYVTNSVEEICRQTRLYL